MLKHEKLKQEITKTNAAAFGRLCVETFTKVLYVSATAQPPSGGCVLKPKRLIKGRVRLEAAAFGRLCVETTRNNK